MKKVIIFGTGDIAQVAHYYIHFDQMAEVAAFTVNQEFIKEDTFEGLPLVAFEEVEQKYPPAEYEMFIATSYAKMNKVREKIFNEARMKGYSFFSYISPRATVYDNVKIGENCFIFEDNTVQPFVEIGNNVTLWSGNHIGHHSKIKDHNFISSHVVVSGGCVIENNCFFGVNATLRDHITIAPETFIGPNALILADTTEKGVYMAQEAEKLRATSDRLRGI